MLKFKETMLFGKLMGMTQRLKDLGSFQVEMRETSDVMHQLAMAYGEREILESCIKFLQKIKNPENKRVFELITRLYGCDLIFRDSSFYMLSEVLTPSSSHVLTKTRLKLI